jgi:hypothetical protein
MSTIYFDVLSNRNIIVKDVDSSAPAAWKNMIEDGSSDLDKLDESTKNEINRWNLQRVGLIQRRMQQELESKLEDLDIEEIKPSKPFFRVLVTTNINDHDENDMARNDCNQAFVTIWDHLPEQIDLLDIGAVIRIKNLDARGSRYEGLRQFSGGPSTSILPLSTVLLHKSRTLLQRNYTSLFSLHLQSKRFLKDASHDSNDKVSVLGILLDARKHEVRDEWLVYLTDKSQLLVKVQCENPSDKLRSYLINGLSTDIPVLVEFRSMLVMKFDDIEQCAVVKYSNDCRFCENPCCCYSAKALQEWSTSDDGYASILKSRSYLNVGVQELKNFQAHRKDAIGYISGLFVLPSQPELILKVDCGSPYLHTWRLPITLVQSLISLCDVNESHKDIVLNEDEEVQLAKLRKVGRIFGSRKKLLCFKLITLTASKTCQNRIVEVLHVSTVDINSLAAMYSVII